MKSYYTLLVLCTLFLSFTVSTISCRKEKNPPSLTTSSITDVTQSSVISGGNVINDGGDEIIARGVCWSTNPDPTINDFFTLDGSGIGEFTSIVTDLLDGTTYYLRAYASNSNGTGYGNSLTFTTIIPSTESVYKPTGLIPATEDQLLSVPTVESVIDKLIPLQNGSKGVPSEYYIDVPTPGDQGSNKSCTSWSVGYGMLGYAFKVIEGHEDYSGDDRNFSPSYIHNQLYVPKIGVPITLALNLVRNQGCCKVTYMPKNANITSQPTTEAKANAAKFKITSIYRLGNVDINRMKLLLSNDYPLMIGLHIDKAFQSGEIDKQPDGRVVWKKYANLIRNPLDMHSVLICGYDDNINAFKVLNSWGTAWGNAGYFYIDYEFIKNAVINLFVPEIYIAVVERPRITTISATEIRYNYAECGGKITNDYGHPVTQKGICYSSRNNDPTIEDTHTSEGGGSGSFTSSIINLTPNTLYFARSYAINSEGISYGLITTFTTPRSQTLPTVTVNSVTNYSQTTATCGGNVTNTGGGTITAKGVSWSTSQNPTIANRHTTDGTGLGSFTSNLTGLTPGTLYYVRAYATNSVGTAYSTNQVSFTTTDESGTIPLNGLVAYYPFNGNANDGSGNGNNGTVYGATLTEDRYNISNRAYRFNGTSNYISVASSSSFPSTAISICFWFNRESNLSTGPENYIDKENSFQVCYNYNTPSYLGAGIFRSIGYCHWYDAYLILNNSNWVFYTFTFNNTERIGRTYINGVLIDSKTETDSNYLLHTSTYPMYIGRNGSSSVYNIRGKMDDIRIYNRAITQQEITSLYNE